MDEGWDTRDAAAKTGGADSVEGWVSAGLRGMRWWDVRWGLAREHGEREASTLFISFYGGFFGLVTF